jgi:hypothetical protein
MQEDLDLNTGLTLNDWPGSGGCLNWKDVAKYVPERDKEQCERRYRKMYDDVKQPWDERNVNELREFLRMD